jgi:hypothetical protein
MPEYASNRRAVRLKGYHQLIDITDIIFYLKKFSLDSAQQGVV